MTKIPKKIHYVWFPAFSKREYVMKHVNQWKSILTDYEFYEWNEDNFDVNITEFSKEAYSQKQWAFVSDVCRLWVLKEYGGIYLDVDTVIYKKFDDLLNYSFFIGYSNEKNIQLTVFGAEEHNNIINEWFELYKYNKFNFQDIFKNSIPNTELISKYLIEKGFELDGKTKEFSEKCMIFSKDYFTPLDVDTGIINITKNTYSLHEFDASWLSQKMKIISYFSKLVKLFFYYLEIKFHIPNSYNFGLRLIANLRNLFIKLNQ